MNIPVNKVGQTDVKVTALSFGGTHVGNFMAAISDATATEIIKRAWVAGIRYFDTAAHYGRGLSEQRLGQVLSRQPRDAYVLSSKVGRVLSPGQPMDEADGFVDPLPNAVRYDYSADGINESFEIACARLGTTYLDITLVHDIGEFTHGAADNARHMEDFLSSGMGALHDLKQAGRTGAIGLGVNEVPVCLDIMQHMTLDAILLAGRLTLLDRAAEPELLTKCAEHGTSLVLGGIFNSGILALGPVSGARFNYGPAPQDILDQAADLQTRAAKVGLTLPQAALHFGMNHPAACSVLLGAGSVDVLNTNLADAALPLSDAARVFVTT